jgi:hypothetical protein
MARSRATEASCQHTVGHWISAEEALRCQRKAYRPTNLQVCTYSVPVREMKEKVYGEVLGHCSSVPLGALGLGALGSSQCIAKELE